MFGVEGSDASTPVATADAATDTPITSSPIFAVAASGQPPSSSTWDPGRVYFVGYVVPGDCTRMIIALVEDPAHPFAGFDCSAWDASFRVDPKRQRVLYANHSDSTVRAFQCEGCPLTSVTGYPRNPLANDPVIPTPGCDYLSMPSAFALIAPDGTILHTCGDRKWYDEQGALVYTEQPDAALMSLGTGHLALAGGTGVGAAAVSAVVDLATKREVAVTGFPDDRSLGAVRATQHGFFVVAIGPAPAALPEAWLISESGVATSLGTYPPAPADVIVGWQGAVDASGAFYQSAIVPISGKELIVRRTIENRESAIVYDERTHPLGQFHGFQLFTGP